MVEYRSYTAQMRVRFSLSVASMMYRLAYKSYTLVDRVRFPVEAVYSSDEKRLSINYENYTLFLEIDEYIVNVRNRWVIYYINQITHL
jgi:hypothetical protein